MSLLPLEIILSVFLCIAFLLIRNKTVGQSLFGYGSPVSMGVFRILVGVVSLVNWLMIAVDFDAWFTERGYVPWWVTYRWLGDAPRLDLIAGVKDTRLIAAFYCLVVIASLLTALGLWTRISSIALALGTVTLHHRNPIILHGGDTVLRMAVMLVAIAPSGASCSLDRLIAVWKGRALVRLPDVSLWPQRIMQYQLALIYFTTVWHKWFGTHWKDGTATWYPANLTEFDRFPVPWFVDRQPFVMVTTYATLLIEFSLGTLVFYRPCRKWVLLAGILLHASIEYRFNIPLFGFAICTFYIAFYGGEEVSEWAKRFGARLSRSRLTVRLPINQVFRPGPRAAVEGMDAFGLVDYLPGHLEHWEAADSEGARRPPFFGSWLRSPGGWPLAAIWRRLLESALMPVEESPPIAESEKTNEKIRR